MTAGKTRKLCLTAMALVAMAATLTIVFGRMSRASCLESLRVGIEDVARRLISSTGNLRRITAINNAAALAKAHAFARIVAADRGILTDRSRLEQLRRELDVDELHVSNAKGILVASIPRDYEGYDMSSQVQSAPFMAAVTNAEFELVQDPLPKGIDKVPFQYAGVSRIDVPGVVQVGFRVERLAEARKMADVDEIAAATRLGRNGFVKVSANDGHDCVINTFYPAEIGGKNYVCISAICDERRITAGLPDPWRMVACNSVLVGVVIFDVMVFLLVFLALFPSFGVEASRHVKAIGVLLGGIEGPADGYVGQRANGGGFFSNPTVFVCAAAFLSALAVAWTVEAFLSEKKAKDLLITNVADMREEITESVNDMLFFIGNAICRHYRSPEAMTQNIVDEVMKRYDIDELNVVNEKGIIIAGAIADVGFDMGSNPKSALFNRLLDGVRTYAQPFRSAIENPSIVRKYAGVAFPDAKGYIQIGFDQHRMKHDIHYRFENAAMDHHIGKNGYFVCADAETGQIVSCGSSAMKPGDTLAGIGYDISLEPAEPGKCFKTTLFGKRCLCLSEVLAFHRIIAVLPYSEISGVRNSTIALTAMILLAVFVGFAFFVSRLTDLVARLKGFIAAEKRRLETDMTTAKTIQTSSLPVVFPDTREFKIFARMDTAREVGGDFYDFYQLPSGRTLFLVADVSGKGIPAAMFMMKARTVLKTSMFSSSDMAEAVAVANMRLVENNDAEMFVTAWIGIFDPATGEVQYVNAGHNPPMIRRSDGMVEELREKASLVLAAIPGVKYTVRSCRLAPGDSILLYTDGVTEATNSAEELYGIGRLRAALMRSGGNFVTEIRADVDAFVAGADMADDITMLALDFKAYAGGSGDNGER